MLCNCVDVVNTLSVLCDGLAACLGNKDAGVCLLGYSWQSSFSLLTSEAPDIWQKGINFFLLSFASDKSRL